MDKDLDTELDVLTERVKNLLFTKKCAWLEIIKAKCVGIEAIREYL